MWKKCLTPAQKALMLLDDKGVKKANEEDDKRDEDDCEHGVDFKMADESSCSDSSILSTSANVPTDTEYYVVIFLIAKSTSIQLNIFKSVKAI